MTDPTVSNVRVTARPMTGPREGLPPCFQMAVYEDRRLIMHLNCPTHTNPDSRYAHLAVGPLTRWDFGCKHAGMSFPYPLGTGDESNIVTYADDPDEAQAAFDKGAEYVRTGVLE